MYTQKELKLYKTALVRKRQKRNLKRKCTEIFYLTEICS